MKIIKESGAVHWAILQEVECTKCRSVFQAETENDFRDYHGGYNTYVWMTCPCCGAEQKVFKKWNVKLNVLSEQLPEIINLPSGHEYIPAGDDVDKSSPFTSKWIKTTEET